MIGILVSNIPVIINIETCISVALFFVRLLVLLLSALFACRLIHSGAIMPDLIGSRMNRELLDIDKTCLW
jgi:hypothetical protein